MRPPWIASSYPIKIVIYIGCCPGGSDSCSSRNPGSSGRHHPLPCCPAWKAVPWSLLVCWVEPGIIVVQELAVATTEYPSRLPDLSFACRSAAVKGLPCSRCRLSSISGVTTLHAFWLPVGKLSWTPYSPSKPIGPPRFFPMLVLAYILAVIWCRMDLGR